ncbi:MAG: DUF4386 family protein [Pseudomonadales bacterium]|nr:DUF4386 family protein [Pseudomonadales bacterium]
MERDSATSLTLGQAALIAGLGLLVMTLSAPYAEFYVFPKVLLPDDIDGTVTNLIAHRGLYVSGLAAFFLNYVADVVVAWALFVFLSPVNRQLSMLAALFRLLYTALGISALMNLFSVVRLLDLPQYTSQVSSGQINVQLQLLLDAYRIEWGVALILFGVHLVLVGFLLVRSGYVPRLLGYLVALAGLGYIVYMIGLYAFPAISFALVTITFLLEPVFMVWLLWKGRQLER